MKKRIITIGREFGSGGHDVGVELANALKIPLYDKELLSKIKADGTFSDDFLSQYEETAPGLFILPAFYSGGLSYTYQQSFSMMVFEAERDKIQKLARDGSGVFIGRCSDYILREFDSINFFICGDEENRIDRALKMHLCEQERDDRSGKIFSRKEVAKIIAKTDRERSRYYEYYSDKRWGDVRNYHLCLNTSRMDILGTAKVILDYLEELDKRITFKIV